MNATNRCYLSLIPFAAHTISSDKISPDKFCRQYYPEHYVVSYCIKDILIGIKILSSAV